VKPTGARLDTAFVLGQQVPIPDGELDPSTSTRSPLPYIYPAFPATRARCASSSRTCLGRAWCPADARVDGQIRSGASATGGEGGACDGASPVMTMKREHASCVRRCVPGAGGPEAIDVVAAAVRNGARVSLGSATWILKSRSFPYAS
jgi:hypothetical protein